VNGSLRLRRTIFRGFALRQLEYLAVERIEKCSAALPFAAVEERFFAAPRRASSVRILRSDGRFDHATLFLEAHRFFSTAPVENSGCKFAGTGAMRSSMV
jgi:hypothetical protein